MLSDRELYDAYAEGCGNESAGHVGGLRAVRDLTVAKLAEGPEDVATIAREAFETSVEGDCAHAVETIATAIRQALAQQEARRGSLEAENRILRGLVQTNPDWRCPHGMNVDNIAKCPAGFPGCACADDRIAVLCEDGSRVIDNLRSENALLRAHTKEPT